MWSARGPRTGFIDGSSGDAASDSAGAPATDGATCAVGGGAEAVREHAATPKPEAPAASVVSRRRRRGRIMAARYTLTETYDKRTLTLPRCAPRFVSLHTAE